MALLWIDGFEGYGTSTGSAPSPAGVMARRYTMSGESSSNIETGRLGGYCFELGSTSTYHAQTPALTTNATMIVGFAYRRDYGTASYTFAQMYDGVADGMGLYHSSTGELYVIRGTTVQTGTSGLNLANDTWYWVEFKVLCNNSAGTYEVKIGGTTVLSASGVDTREGAHDYHDRFRLKTATSTRSRFDDFYVCDGSGTSNNDFLGNCKVTALHPDGAGNSTQWTPSAGANYACVDEVIADDDTTYVEDTVAAQADLYTHGNLASGTTGIKGVQINADCRETDATSYDLKINIRSNATDYVGSGQTLGTTNYTTKRRLAEQDPNTSAAWTESGVNAAEFGIEVG